MHRLKSPSSMARLVAWYRQNARDLPWRRTRDPYAVLVSEFMAQQTQIATVVGYYKRWMNRFPSVRALAKAEEPDVLAIWQGLGYYSRARNLHRAAKAIVERHGGVVPDDLEALRALPGIGEYTAGAVMAFAFDRAAPVVDANVARVLARVIDLQEPIESAAGRRAMREAALALQPETGAGEFNSALMELGALVCKPRNPLCPECPIRGACRARDPESLPRKKERPVTTKVTERRAFIVEGDRIHLAKSDGRWKGMWILPETDVAGEVLHVETYPITRFRVRMEVVASPPAPGLTAFRLDSLDDVAIPSPHRRVIRALAGARGSVHPEA